MTDFVFENEAYYDVEDSSNNCEGCAFQSDSDGCAQAFSVKNCLVNEIIWIKKDEQQKQPDLPSVKQEGGNHYKLLGIQPVEYIQANSLNFFEGNVVKYVTRHRSKNKAQDIKKAIHYLQLILQYEYSEVSESEVDNQK